MPFAYIITAYKDPKHLRRLITSLTPDAHFFIHIDAKVELEPFKRELAGLNNIKFTENRFFINWGGFGQVRSQKELLKTVFSTAIPFDRIICISGTDYPLWSNDQIQKTFDSNQEFIMGFNVTKGIHEGQKRRVRVYHFFRDIPLRNLFFKRLFSGGSRKIMMFLPFRKKSTVEILGVKRDVFMGSDYWALTYACAQYVYKAMCGESKLMNYFKTAFVPSEMVVQTIVFNSDFALQAFLVPGPTYPALANLTPLHYIHYRGAIKILKLEDLDEILASNKMFFRKAQTHISDSLLDKVDELRLRSKMNILQ